MRFIESGDFLWNSGIFIWSLKSIQQGLRRTPAEDERAVRGRRGGRTARPKEAAFISQTYPDCESISIDYGVMEKAKNVYVVMGDFGWSDLGTWGSLFTHLPKDANGNAVLGREREADDCLTQRDPQRGWPPGRAARAGGLHRGEHPRRRCSCAASTTSRRSSRS